MSKEPFEHEHASYGMITLERTYGSDERLFGSDLEHDQYYLLRVYNASEITYGLELQEYRAKGQAFLQLRLTPAQVVGLIHNVDRRPGTPCTIAFMEGHELSMPPKRNTHSPIDELISMAEKRGHGLKKLLDTNLEEMDTILSKRGIKNDDKTRLRGMVSKAIRAVTSEVPFTVKRIHEAAGKIIAQAKSEIDAYRTFNPGPVPAPTRAEATLDAVSEILWPVADPGGPWKVDTIEHVAAEVSDYFQHTTRDNQDG